MLLEFPIDGKTVNGKTNFANSICEDFLGADLSDYNTRGQSILLSRLKTYYNNLILDENSTEEMKIIKTRCYLMLLIDSFLFYEDIAKTRCYLNPKCICPNTTSRYSKNTPGTYNTNLSSYHSQNAQTSYHSQNAKHHTIAKIHKHRNNYMTFKHHNNHFNISSTYCLHQCPPSIVQTTHQ